MKKLLLIILISAIGLGFFHKSHSIGRLINRNNKIIQTSKKILSNKFVKTFLIKKSIQLAAFAGIYSAPFFNQKNKQLSWNECHMQGTKNVKTAVKFVEYATLAFFASPATYARTERNGMFLGH